jgi:nitrite reductase/ring-hydroxylating ferredoxin subunit
MMMNWIRVLAQADLPEAARQVVTVAETEILLINHGGRVYAVGSRCPHLRARLEKGEVTDEGTIVCPRHHSEFDLETGAVQAWVPWPPVVGRALGAITQEHRLPVLPTKVEDGSIWVATENRE